MAATKFKELLRNIEAIKKARMTFIHHIMVNEVVFKKKVY